MGKLDSLKEKAMSALGTIIDKSTTIYENAEEKAKYLAKTAKLKADIAKDNSQVKKLYADLGSLYYCLNSENPDEKLVQICDEIKAVLDRIEVKQHELKSISDEASEKDIVLDITEDEAHEAEEESSADEISEEETAE